MKAIWNEQILAESNRTIIIENNHYFPIASLNMALFKSSETKTQCSWKGEASYFSIIVAGSENKDAAWYYPSPKEAAKEIIDYVAFWQGVEVTE